MNERNSHLKKLDIKSEGKKILVGGKRKKTVKFEDESVLEKENCIKVKNGRVETSEGKMVSALVRPDYIHSVLEQAFVQK